MNSAVTLTREKLYEEVWTVPIVQLAKRYRISDVGLSKICRRLNVPRPSPGYWAQIAAGQTLPRTPLPARALQTSYVLRPTPPKPIASPEEILALEKRMQLVATFADVRVPTTLETPHALTRRTQAHFQRVAKEAARPRKWGTPAFWDGPRDQKGRFGCSAQIGYPIVVSLEQVDRALRILDTLVKALIRIGFSIGPDDKSENLQLRKDGEAFELSLREGYKYQELSADERRAREKLTGHTPDKDWKGTGKLTLALNGTEYAASREWSDSRAPLEDRLADILSDFVELVPLQQRKRQERIAEEARRAEAQRREWDEETRRREEKAFFDALAAEADKVEKLESILRYLDRLEAELLRSGNEIDEKPKEWLAHARGIVAAHNPMPARLRALSPGKASEGETA